MSYVDRSLVPGETVVYCTRLHWIVFMWPFLITAIAVGFLVYGQQYVAEALGAIAVVLWIARYFVYIASGTRESFSNIGSPLEFRKALQSASME
jgi:hypothetical protein